MTSLLFGIFAIIIPVFSVAASLRQLNYSEVSFTLETFTITENHDQGIGKQRSSTAFMGNSGRHLRSNGIGEEYSTAKSIKFDYQISERDGSNNSMMYSELFPMDNSMSQLYSSMGGYLFN
jgi:hypothetical protein